MMIDMSFWSNQILLNYLVLHVINALNQGYSVVVSSPTGSGKTLVGEYAIYRAMAHGKKVFQFHRHLLKSQS